MPRKDLIFWIDLETTGSSDAEHIVEIGAAFTTATDFSVLSTFSQVIKPSMNGWDRLEANEFVLNMHKKSGLYEDMKSSTVTLNEASTLLMDWFHGVAGTTEHVPLAGSGVSHFDRKYIRRDLPELDSRLTYWAYDVGVLRRTFQLVGAPTYIAGDVYEPKHRGLDDVRMHIDEFKFYTGLIGTEWGS